MSLLSKLAQVRGKTVAAFTLAALLSSHGDGIAHATQQGPGCEIEASIIAGIIEANEAIGQKVFGGTTESTYSIKSIRGSGPITDEMYECIKREFETTYRGAYNIKRLEYKNQILYVVRKAIGKS